jgi:hypothetical protein
VLVDVLDGALGLRTGYAFAEETGGEERHRGLHHLAAIGQAVIEHRALSWIIRMFDVGLEIGGEGGGTTSRRQRSVFIVLSSMCDGLLFDRILYSNPVMTTMKLL